MTEPWMDGARTEPVRSSRARLALVLLVAIVLPVAIVGLGSRRAADATVEVAALAPVAAADTADAAGAGTAATSPSSTSTTTEAPPTTEAPTTEAPTTEVPTTVATTAAPPPAPVSQALAPVSTAAPTTAAPSTTAAPVVTAPTQGASADDLVFLACVRRRESGGNYAIVSSNGLYYGAYQFLRSTWNSAANIAGRPDLVGLAPNTVSPADQDAVALAYYHVAGSAPWGGAC